MIQPMIKALRNNDINAIRSYEDISIKLDDIAFNYRKDIELAGKVEELFKERNSTIELKRRSTVENLVMDLCLIGIFDSLDDIQIKKLVEKLVQKQPIDEKYNNVKTMAIKAVMNLNEKIRSDKLERKSEPKKAGLISLYDEAIKTKEYSYEVLKRNGYIKNPIDEFLISE